MGLLGSESPTVREQVAWAVVTAGVVDVHAVALHVVRPGDVRPHWAGMGCWCHPRSVSVTGPSERNRG